MPSPKFSIVHPASAYLQKLAIVYSLQFLNRSLTVAAREALDSG